ncbi:MAG: sulfite exporter TauE/SafE family protein [Cellvibrionaceae bacterium]
MFAHLPIIDIPLLDTSILLFLVFIALLTGFVKSGLPALGGLVSVMLVSVFPAKDALGITLFYLLAGDVIAVTFYWRQVNVVELKRLLPMIFVGIGTGILVLSVVNDQLLGLVIGSMIIFLVLLEPFRTTVSAWAMRHIVWIRNISGWLAGLTTTVGNAAGPILSLYFLLLKLDKHSFTGTAAVFFLIVNTVKLPLYGSIGIFKAYYLSSVLLTVPFVFVGAYFGRQFLKWIPQQQFTQIILAFTGLAGLSLIIRYFI